MPRRHVGGEKGNREKQRETDWKDLTRICTRKKSGNGAGGGWKW